MRRYFKYFTENFYEQKDRIYYGIRYSKFLLGKHNSLLEILASYPNSFTRNSYDITEFVIYSKFLHSKLNFVYSNFGNGINAT